MGSTKMSKILILGAIEAEKSKKEVTKVVWDTLYIRTTYEYIGNQATIEVYYSWIHLFFIFWSFS